MESSNNLFPIFMRLDKLRILIVGAGEVGYEKLFFMLKSSKKTHITLVAPEVNPSILDLIRKYPETEVDIVKKEFELDDISDHDIVIAATNIPTLNRKIWAAAKEKRKIVNVADTPDLCDFYMGSIVTKGDLKIAISTNGKSPTLAKRIRQVMEEVFPNDTVKLLENLHLFRNTLKTNFEQKVRILNDMTESMLLTIKN